MGTPVPTPPIDYGNTCLICSPPLGSLWESGKTPLNVYVYFAGLKGCGGTCLWPPNGKTFKLTQHPAESCVWVHYGSVWTVWWDASFGGGPESRLSLWQPDRRTHFYASSVKCPEECHIYHNEQVDCGGGRCATGGLAVIHWMGIVLGIIVGMSLPTASQVMHELFVKDESQIVHKFCFPLYGMNVKMLMSP